MWFASPAAAAILSIGCRTADFGMFGVMAEVDCSQYLDDNLYQKHLAGVDHLGILLHPTILRGKHQAIQLLCAPSSQTILAESAGTVQCQGDSNCVLNGLKLHANEVRWIQESFLS